ncbi:MAG: hypothetical protein R2857_10730 [Vampirovibrionales bacterium]
MVIAPEAFRMKSFLNLFGHDGPGIHGNRSQYPNRHCPRHAGGTFEVTTTLTT